MLADLDSLKLMLGVTGSSQDDLLTLHLQAADQAVKTHCGQSFESAEYTEFYSGNGQRDLVLRHRPWCYAVKIGDVVVTTPTRVWVDQSGAWGHNPTAFGDDTELTLGTQFSPQSDNGDYGYAGLLRRLGMGHDWFATGGVPSGRLAMPYRHACWPVGDGNIKVHYAAGYIAVPNDLKHAVLTLAAALNRTGKFAGQTIASESLGEYAVSFLSYGQSQEMTSVRSLLANYRELDA